MPKLTLTEKSDRFPGEFELTTSEGQALSEADRSYAAAIARIMEKMMDDTADDPIGADDASIARRDLRLEKRRAALAALRAEADDVSRGDLDSSIAADNAFVIRGKYIGEQDRISSSLFAVGPKVENSRVVDVIIAVADIPVGEDDPSTQEKRTLYVALDNARTVVGAVAQHIQDKGKAADLDRAKRMRERYMTKLVEIGRLGLQGPHVELGRLALDGFRAEFVAQEAGRIKNSYVRSLGAAAIVAALIALAIFALIYGAATDAGARSYGNFLLAAVGAAVGSWLSFSIRKVTLSFEELAVPETDLLEPGLRIIFVILLTTIVLLLFWTGAMNIEIGTLKTGELRSTTTSLPMGAIALLVGAFCGLSERALATAVSGRSAAFVGTVSA